LKHISYNILFRLGIMSLAVNGVILVFALSANKDYIGIPRLETGDTNAQIAAACIVTMPVSDSGGPAVSFGTISVTLREGDTAYLQISALEHKVQSYTRLQYRCDRSIVDVSNDRFRTRIAARAKGQTMLEALTDSGLIPVCLVTVE
jgi:hypothetical protein